MSYMTLANYLALDKSNKLIILLITKFVIFTTTHLVSLASSAPVYRHIHSQSTGLHNEQEWLGPALQPTDNQQFYSKIIFALHIQRYLP